MKRSASSAIATPGKKYSKTSRTVKKYKKPVRRGLVDCTPAGFGFPPELKIKLRYAENIALTGTAGGTGQYLFSCNGLYDPNITSTGHQPMYFDQIMAVYDHYTVLSSKITINLCPQDATAAGPFQVSLFLNDDASLSTTSLLSLAESNEANTRIVADNANTSITLVKYWNQKRYFPGSALANNVLQGSSGANPTEQTVYALVIGALDGVSTVNCFAQVLIEYTAIFGETAPITGS